jgi:GNAT superfamily N-acetyltransferase
VPLAGFRGARREHRTVVLPDFQGVGIGNALSEWLGAYLKARGLRLRSVRGHPAMIRHRARSPKWRLCRFGHGAQHRTADARVGDLRKTGSAGRITASFEYVGPALGPQPAGEDEPRDTGCRRQDRT